MTGTVKPLYILIGLLVVDALFELSFVSATVAFLHRRAGGSFEVNDSSSSFSLHGKPEFLLLDQGHVSNGAAGTAIVLVGIGGLLTFLYLSRNSRTRQLPINPSIVLTSWLAFSFVSMLLTLAALIYVQVVTSKHSGQHVNVDVASHLNNHPYPNYVAYPLDTWTPENWFAAVLDLDLASSSDRSLIRQKYNVMKGWRWNLIPMFVLGVAVFVTGLMEMRVRRAGFSGVHGLREKHRDVESEESYAPVPAPTGM